MTWRSARRQWRCTTTRPSSATSTTAVRATDKCMRILGGYGLVEETPMERLFRDTRLGPFSPISNEMVKNFLGERMGLPKSY